MRSIMERPIRILEEYWLNIHSKIEKGKIVLPHTCRRCWQDFDSHQRKIQCDHYTKQRGRLLLSIRSGRWLTVSLSWKFRLPSLWCVRQNHSSGQEVISAPVKVGNIYDFHRSVLWKSHHQRQTSFIRITSSNFSVGYSCIFSSIRADCNHRFAVMLTVIPRPYSANDLLIYVIVND